MKTRRILTGQVHQLSAMLSASAHVTRTERIRRMHAAEEQLALAAAQVETLTARVEDLGVKLESTASELRSANEELKKFREASAA